MYKKRGFKRLVVGFACAGLIAIVISIYLWPCSVILQCPNGGAVWCQTFGGCPAQDQQCTSHNEGYVVCICVSGTYIIEKCDGTTKTPSVPYN